MRSYGCRSRLTPAMEQDRADFLGQGVVRHGRLHACGPETGIWHIDARSNCRVLEVVGRAVYVIDSSINLAVCGGVDTMYLLNPAAGDGVRKFAMKSMALVRFGPLVLHTRPPGLTPLLLGVVHAAASRRT